MALIDVKAVSMLISYKILSHMIKEAIYTTTLKKSWKCVVKLLFGLFQPQFAINKPHRTLVFLK